MHYIFLHNVQRLILSFTETKLLTCVGVPGRTDTSPQWQCGNVIAVLWFPLVATRCSCGVVCCQPEHWLEIMDLNKQSFRDDCIISS